VALVNNGTGDRQFWHGLDGGKIIRQATREKYQNVYLRLQALAYNYQEYKQERRLQDYVEACGHNVRL